MVKPTTDRDASDTDSSDLSDDLGELGFGDSDDNDFESVESPNVQVQKKSEIASQTDTESCRSTDLSLNRAADCQELSSNRTDDNNAMPLTVEANVNAIGASGSSRRESILAMEKRFNASFEQEEELRRAQLLSTKVLAVGGGQLVNGAIPSDDFGAPRRVPSEQEALVTVTQSNVCLRSSREVALKTLGQKGRSFKSALEERLHKEEHDSTIVVYLTSLEAIRETAFNCSAVLKLFVTLGLRIRKKDVHFDPSLLIELEERAPGAQLPMVFINSEPIGGRQELESMNDSGKLGKLTEGFARRPTSECLACGDIAWSPCGWCQGTAKSSSHRFEADATKNRLKCTMCRGTGVVPCKWCSL